MKNAEWLNKLADLGGRKMQEIGFGPFLVAVGVSLLCALFISFLYVRLYQNRTTGSMVHRAFPLLGVSITAIFITIQFSLPLSLGLLGALSIVRFRTPIKEPEEIGFIMLVVATSLCCATFNLMFLGIILAMAVAGLLAQGALGNFWRSRRRSGLLVVTVPGAAYAAGGAGFLEAVQARLPRLQLESVAHVGEDIHVSWGLLETGEGVAARLPELEQLLPGARAQVFCHRAGEG
jgi:MFS family permease